MTYKYFISYMADTDFIANTDVELNRKITCMDDIKGIERAMKIKGGTQQVVITNWKLFDD